VRHWTEYLIVILLRTVVRALPRRFVLAVGSFVGWIFYALYGRRRRVAIANLRAAFPVKSEGEGRQIARRAFANFGRHVMDVLKFDAMTPDQMLSLIDVEGADRVEHAMAQGKGVMFYTGHFGFWELQIMVHAIRFEPILMVARTLDNPLLDALMARIRSRVGTRVIPRQGAIRGLLRGLLRGESVGMMIDQHIQDRSAVPVEFFGRPAATTSGIAMLALRTGSPVIPVFSLPLSGGRYRLVYEPPVPPPGDEAADPVREFTQRCTDVLEMYVRRYPDLWLWMHRRWRLGDAAGEPTAAGPMTGEPSATGRHDTDDVPLAASKSSVGRE
jgi:KDO2-lipid IV(A) lauroyltransferase